MLKINGKEFEERVLLPPTDEFPNGFGIELTPTQKKLIDLEKWLDRDVERVVNETRKWGALVVKGIDLKVGIGGPRVHDQWSTVSETSPVSWWHSDGYLVHFDEGLPLRSVVLAHHQKQKLRRLPTLAIPLSSLDRELEKVSKRYVANKMFGKVTPWFREMAAIKTPYASGDRYKKLTNLGHSDHLYSYPFGISKREKEAIHDQVFRDVNAKSQEKMLLHDWRLNPCTAFIINSDDQPTGLSSVLHACFNKHENDRDLETNLMHRDLFS